MYCLAEVSRLFGTAVEEASILVMKAEVYGAGTEPHKQLAALICHTCELGAVMDGVGSSHRAHGSWERLHLLHGCVASSLHRTEFCTFLKPQGKSSMRVG